jgi:hypothetical protein
MFTHFTPADLVAILNIPATAHAATMETATAHAAHSCKLAAPPVARRFSVLTVRARMSGMNTGSDVFAHVLISKTTRQPLVGSFSGMAVAWH